MPAARPTQAQMQQAIRAAKAEGMTAIVLRDGIAFVEPDKVPLPHPPQIDPFDMVDMSR